MDKLSIEQEVHVASLTKVIQKLEFNIAKLEFVPYETVRDTCVSLRGVNQEFCVTKGVQDEMPLCSSVKTYLLGCNQTNNQINRTMLSFLFYVVSSNKA